MLKEIAVKRNMTIAAVIHQPSVASFLVFDDLLLLGQGGQVVYNGPLDKASDYFALLGFPMPRLCNPADFFLDVVSGECKREGHPDFTPEDLFVLWEEYRITDHISSDYKVAEEGCGLKRMVSTLSFTSEDGLVDDVAVPETYGAAIRDNIADTVDNCVAYFNEVSANCFSIISVKQDPCRTTPGVLRQFSLCLVRALKQNFHSVQSWLLESLVHFALGFVMSKSIYGVMVSGLPAAYCQTLTENIANGCLVVPNVFMMGGLYIAFAISFAGVAVGAGTFINETPNYWRECAAGMFTLPYFCAKVLADFPKMLNASFFFWCAFSASFSSTGQGIYLFLTFLLMYWFGYSLGYITSQIASKEMVPVVGVMMSLIFVAAYSTPGTLWFRKLSSPRYTIEAFFLTETEYYNSLPPNSGYEGQQYIDFGTTYQYFSYQEKNFGTDMVMALADGFFWSGVAFLIMSMMNLERKK